jgi:hypothetical protein
LWLSHSFDFFIGKNKIDRYVDSRIGAQSHGLEQESAVRTFVILDVMKCKNANLKGGVRLRLGMVEKPIKSMILPLIFPLEAETLLNLDVIWPSMKPLIVNTTTYPMVKSTPHITLSV